MALDAIADARPNAADRLATPWWYHPVLGLLMAGFVLIYALGNVVVMVAGIFAYFVGIGILAGSYKARTGLWILRVSRRDGRPLDRSAVGHLCHLPRGGRAAGAAVLPGRLSVVEWMAFVAAGAMFAATTIVCGRFNAALRAQLRENP